MTVTELPARGGPPDREAGRAAPEDRGTLEIANGVLRQIAEHAADSNEDTLRIPRRIAGIGAGSTAPRATIFRDDDRVDVALDVGLRYPGSVPQMAASIRDDVRTEINRITGLQVRAVRITVSALLPDSSPRVL